MSHQPRKCSPDSSQQRTSPCGCGPQGATRRTFLKAGTAAAAAAALPGRPIMAGPFEDSDYADVVPLDKRLSPEWVASLTERGEPTVYRGDALQMIGMPVGGICAGMVYLSGDGRLWLWEIFNREVEGILPERQQNITAPNGQRVRTRDGANYLNPQGPWSPFEQGFSLTVHADDGEQVRPLDASGFADVSFCGQWPIGTVAYRDDACPVTAKLEAFSPIAPLATDDSSLPATLMRFTLANPTDKAIDVSIAGRLENAVCLYSKRSVPGLRQNRVVRDGDLAAVVCTAGPLREKVESSRPDIVLDDFEREDYEGWTVEGTAFGDRPLRMADMPEYQGPIGGQGERVVNSHNTRQGEDVRAGDQHTGTLTSKPFQVERNFIVMLIGGGSHKGRTCVNLLVDGQVVDSLTGRDNNHMRQAGFNVKKYEGKKAQLQIVDNEGGGWGNIGVDQIVQSDRPPGGVPLHDLHDFGSMTLALLDGGEAVGRADLEQADGDQAERPLAEPLVGQLGRRVTLPPGGERTVTFAVTCNAESNRVA